MSTEIGDRANSGETEIVDVTGSDLNGSFYISISDPHLRSAVVSALSTTAHGEELRANDKTLTLTDNISSRGHNVVVIVDDTPGTCQQVVEALFAHQLAGIGSRAEISQLPLIVSAAAGSVASVPTRVLRASSQLPKLEDRQRKVLQLLASGLSNTLIANSLHVSQATVKREVSELLRVFQASNRLELVMRSAQLGLVDSTQIAVPADPQTSVSTAIL